METKQGQPVSNNNQMSEFFKKRHKTVTSKPLVGAQFLTEDVVAKLAQIMNTTPEQVQLNLNKDVLRACS